MGDEGEKKFVGVGSLKSGSNVLIDGFPCTIKDYTKSKPGKHGAAKAQITAIGFFDGQKRTLMKPTSAEVETPIIEKGNATVVALMGDIVQIMNNETYETFDAPKPKDVPGIEQGSEIEYAKFGKSIKIVRKR
ncbi:MAG: translation initiation factor IF-5A [Candidatus Diapherotrites archaeon]|nr:translation initiation factor IF-5A [Candidatus Diapherotrites archaeon]